MASADLEETNGQLQILRQRATWEQHKINYERLKALTLTVRAQPLNHMDSKVAKGDIEAQLSDGEERRTEEPLAGTSSKEMSCIEQANKNSGQNHEKADKSSGTDAPIKVLTSLRRYGGLGRISLPYVGSNGEQKKVNLPAVAVTRAQLNQPVKECTQCISYAKDKRFLMDRYLIDMRSMEEMLATEVRATRAAEKINKELRDSALIMTRSNAALKLENETLREELEETRKKLEDSATLNAQLQKNLQQTRFEMSAQKYAVHKTTESNEFKISMKLKMENEIKALWLKNQQLEDSRLLMAESQEEEKREMKALLVSVYTTSLEEKKALLTKYMEVKDILASQQWYVEEIDYFIKGRDGRNDSIIEEFCKELKNVVVDGRGALEVIETDLRRTVSERSQLQTDLQNAVTLLEKAKEDVGRRQRSTLMFVGNILMAIDSPLGPFRSRQLASEKYDVFDGKTLTDREQEMFQDVLMKVLSWKTTQAVKIRHLEKRLETLINSLIREKSNINVANDANKMMANTCNPVATYAKKKKRLARASAYRPKKIVKPQNEHIVATASQVNELPEVVQQHTNTSQDIPVKTLLEHHINFGKILNDVIP